LPGASSEVCGKSVFQKLQRGESNCFHIKLLKKQFDEKMEFNIQLLGEEEFASGFHPSILFERVEKEVVAPHPCTMSFVDSMQRNGQAYTNNTDQSEQKFFNQDELTMYHIYLGDAQSNEAETLRNNRQAYTDIGDQSDRYDQPFLDLHETNQDPALFAKLQNNEPQTNEARVQTNCTPKKTRKRVAIEPALYVDVIKTCTACSSHEVQFKHLNNNKLTQPRYKCLACKKLFVHNPASNRRKHPEGYKKSRESEALQNAVKVCPNPKCGKVGFTKFLYYNNKNLLQPRYKCRACGVSFQYGGHFAKREELEEHAHMVEPNEMVTGTSTTQVSQDNLQDYMDLLEQQLQEPNEILTGTLTTEVSQEDLHDYMDLLEQALRET
jgi:transposase-like protein